MVAFLLFRRLRLPVWVSKAVIFLGPSMFAVYLLHTNNVVLPLLPTIEDELVDSGAIPVCLAVLMTALVVFLLATGVDVLRRLICFVARPLLTVSCRLLDGFYGWLLDRMGRYLFGNDPQ